MRKQVQAIDRSNRLSPTAIDYEVLVLLEKGQDITVDTLIDSPEGPSECLDSKKTILTTYNIQTLM